MRTVLLAGFMVCALVTSARAEDAAYTAKELEGIELKCARNVTSVAWDELRNLSWNQLARLLSLGGAAEMFAAVGGAIRAELRGCFVEVYRIGVEKGRLEAGLERGSNETTADDAKD